MINDKVNYYPNKKQEDFIKEVLGFDMRDA